MGEQDVADQQGAFAIKRRCFFSTLRFFAVLVFVRAGESLLKPPLNTRISKPPSKSLFTGDSIHP